MDSFAGYHPAVTFIYFICVLAFTMFSMHPFFLGCSACCGFVYCCMLGGRRMAAENLRLAAPMILLGMIINPLFNQRGATILFYLNDAAVTLEAVLYGAASAVLFLSAVLWIRCWGKVMSTDKFICLFGRIIPSLGLVLSICFRMIPLLRRRFAQVEEGQRCLGRGDTGRHPMKKIRLFGKELSILIAWSLEAGIETSDSMEARGYGLKGRSSYTIYRFDRRDAGMTVLILALAGLVLAGCVGRVNSILFYPQIVFREQNAWSLTVYAAFGILCILPVIIEILGERKWKRLYSNM